MKYLNNIPVFLATAIDDAATITTISLVPDPAMEVSMQCFSKEDKFKFSVDESQHSIISCIVRCDYPIIRVDASGNPYYIVFNKETSKTLCQKLMSDGYQQNISIYHNGELIDGINLQEVFLKDTERGISPIGFEEVADGSLFGIYHITDENLWQDCVDGKFAGVSMETYLNIQEFNKITNKKITKMSKIKKALENLLLMFAEVETDKGILEWEGDKQLEVGDAVYQGENPAPDGEYKVGDKIFVVVEGRVAEIKEEPLVEEIKEEEMACGDKKKKMEEEVIVEEPKAEEEEIIVEEPKAEEEIKEEIKEDENELRIKAIEERIIAMEAKIEEIMAKLAEPAEAPILDKKEEEDEKNAAEEEMLERLRRLRKN